MSALTSMDRIINTCRVRALGGVAGGGGLDDGVRGRVERG